MIQADRWGPAGAAVAALCCLGWPPVLAALSAAGMGFLIRDAVLIPLLLVFLALTILALSRGRSRHGGRGPERVAWVGALATVLGVVVSGALVAVGLGLLVAASVWNGVLGRRRAKEGATG